MIGSGIGIDFLGGLIGGGAYIRRERLLFFILNAQVATVVLPVLLILECYLWPPSDSGRYLVVAIAVQWDYWIFVSVFSYQCQFFLSLFELFHNFLFQCRHVLFR